MNLLFRYHIVRTRNGVIETTLLGADPESVLAEYMQRNELPASARNFLAVRRAGRQIEFERHGFQFRLLIDCSSDGSHASEETISRIALDRFKRLTHDASVTEQVHQGLQIYHPAVEFCSEAGKVLDMLRDLLAHYQRQGVWTLELSALVNEEQPLF
ncbi:hypothetical protein [Chitinilyticum litopenaei]|uniref:hypothetical protein n=1 Tax=Chitinilyticum litopenaei TaxID=1121276 RepID=UPI0003F69E55|nr:hypothetical protein [Chitinilyticum litopenaei]